MLAVLLIMVLAATFALIVVGAVHSLQVVEGADAASWRAAAAEGRALAAVTHSLRWHPLRTNGAAEGGDPASAESWQAAWTPAPPVSGNGWLRVAVQIVTAAGRASRRDDLVLEVRSEAWAMGVTCAADADVAAPLTVTGSGVYVGGVLRGRENVDFVQGPGPLTPDGVPVDDVRGDVFAAAAVHGGAGIFARGVEVHDAASPGEFPYDTDRHAGEPLPEEWVDGASAEFLLAAQAEAMLPGHALTDGRLRLDEITPASGEELAAGRCLLLPPADEVVVEGSTPVDVGRLLVVARGDAILGRPGETVTLRGGIVVSGRLAVRGPVIVEGSVHARSISIDAPMSIVAPSTWRGFCLPGAALPTLMECGI
jgi:hypothetical protein